MKYLIVLPFIMVTILGFAMELNSIAEDASAKTLNFANDMSNAIPCAAKGIPVTVCSPDLVETDFSEDVEKYMEVLEKINKTTSPVRDALMEELENGESLEDIAFKCKYNKKKDELICSKD